MGTEEIRRRADRNTVDRLLKSQQSSGCAAALALIERERMEIDARWAKVNAVEAANKRLEERHAAIVAENERVKKFASEAKNAPHKACAEKLTRALATGNRVQDELKAARDLVDRASTRVWSIIGVLRGGHDFSGGLTEALDFVQRRVHELVAMKESSEQRAATLKHEGGVWSDARGWVRPGDVALKYPPKTLRCYACGHQLEFNSPAQANQHGWRAVSKGSHDMVICQKMQCQRAFVVGMIGPEHFGWESIHPVDVLVNLGAVSSGSLFEKDLRALADGGIFFRAPKGLPPSQLMQLQKAIDSIGPRSQFVVFEEDESLPMRAWPTPRLEPALQGAPTSPGEAPVKKPHLNPLAHQRCECIAEEVRVAGAYRYPGERWPRCSACSKFLAQPKEATVRRMIFQVR